MCNRFLQIAKKQKLISKVQIQPSFDFILGRYLGYDFIHSRNYILIKARNVVTEDVEI